MNRKGTCLNFRAMRVDIHGNVGTDIRFSTTILMNKEPAPATDYGIETRIFDKDGLDVSETYNFAVVKEDGLARFSMEDSVTSAMGPGTWTYSIDIILVLQDDYDRCYMNGAFELYERSDIS
jgi:hypothetical protein